MRRSVQKTLFRHDRQARHFHHRQPCAGHGPGRAAGRQSHHPEVRRGVEVSGHVVVGDVGDWKIRQVVTDVHERRRAGSGPGDFEYVARLRRRIEVVARVRDPGAMRVRRIDGDSRDEPVGVGRRHRVGVDAIPDDGSGGGVRVVGDEHAPGTGRGPKRARVGGPAPESRQGVAGAAAPDRRRQIARRRAADAHEVTAAWLGGGCRELRTVGFQEGLIAAPVLRPPDAEGTLEDRAAAARVRIRDDRRVEERCLRAHDDRRGDDHPFRRIAVPEVRVVRLTCEGVEANGLVGGAETGLAAIAIDDLVPGRRLAAVLPGAIVLGSALQHVPRMLLADREALELQRREAAVDVVGQLMRHAPEQALAQRQVGGVEPARVALG